MKRLLAFLVAFVFLLPSSMVFSKNLQDYDYVIITTDDLQNSLKNFTEWKESMGYSIKIVTTSWINSNYNGKDSPEKIRNFLIDKYEQWGINYVLIVGSRDKIPMRECYPISKSHAKDYMVQTDYYYADLNGNWDSDNDGYYGEIGQDKPDFYPELYVGRIPSDSANKVKSICQHIINFEKSNEKWKKNVLLAGAIIFYENYTNAWGTWHRIDTATPEFSKMDKILFDSPIFEMELLFHLIMQENNSRNEAVKTYFSIDFVIAPANRIDFCPLRILFSKENGRSIKCLYTLSEIK